MKKCERIQKLQTHELSPDWKSYSDQAYGARTRAPWTKAPRRQNLKIFSTLFLGKNKLKQRNYTKTKLRLEEFNKTGNFIQKR